MSHAAELLAGTALPVGCSGPAAATALPHLPERGSDPLQTTQAAGSPSTPQKPAGPESRPGLRRSLPFPLPHLLHRQAAKLGCAGPCTPPRPRPPRA